MSELISTHARGKVISTDAGKIIFAPANTNYRLYLALAAGSASPEVGRLIDAEIRLTARKIYTVPSGGGFVSPIFGPPRTVQGRVIRVDDNAVVIRAGTYFIIQLPRESDAIDLSEGVIQAGSMVNAVCLPGGSFTPVMSSPAASAEAAAAVVS